MSQYFTSADGVRHKLPDDATPEEIDALFPAAPDSSRMAPKAPAAAPERFSDPRVSQFLKGYGTVRPNPGMLPAVGGFVGGIGGAALAGFPTLGIGAVQGGIGGAAIGGAIGEAANEALSGKPLGWGIAGRGALEGANQAVGLGLAAGAGRLARPLIGKALSIVPSLADRFHVRPEDIAEIVLKERAPVTFEGKQALWKSGSAVRSARNAAIKGTRGLITAKTLANVTIRDAESSLGRPLTRFERDDLISTVEKEANDILTRRTHGAVPKGQRGTPAQPPSTLVNQYGQPAIPGQAATPPPPTRYNMWETEQVKEVAAKNAKPAFGADRAGTSVSADPALSKQIASSARSKLNKIGGVKEQNARMSELKSARLAIEDALARGTDEWTPLQVGPLHVGFKVPRKSLGDLAHSLNNPRVQATLRQLPRGIEAALLQLMHAAQPDETGGGY